MNRRQFLKTAGGTGLLGSGGMGLVCENLDALGQIPNLSEVEASHYDRLDDREIKCRLCPRECRLGDRERGYCGVRENRNGRYLSLVYGKACAIHIDPIEKKPFYHFLPGNRTLSLATAGCNVNCRFCQNWEISQVRPEQVRHVDFPPDEVVRTAREKGCPVIAYTYTEPVVFFEYMMDTAERGRRQGIRSAVVTGGYINEEPLKELCGTVDAVKVDLKAFNPDFYTRYVQGKLEPVLKAIEILADSPIWLEIVYLVIPSLNDDREEIRRLCRWLKGTAGPDVPIHFSRFQPMYLLKNLPPTPVSTLERVRNTALAEGLRYVYIGNVPGHEGEQTFCPSCRGTVIRRTGYQTDPSGLQDGLCARCRTPIPGVWT